MPDDRARKDLTVESGASEPPAMRAVTPSLRFLPAPHCCTQAVAARSRSQQAPSADPRRERKTLDDAEYRGLTS